MTLRGAVTRLDRFLASLTYLLPLSSVLSVFVLGAALLLRSNIMSPILSVIDMISTMSDTFLGRYGSLIVFFGLYLLVVRNNDIKYLIRFHTMQSLLIVIASSLVGLMLSLLGPVLGSLLGLLVSLATVGTSVYSMLCAIMGKYGAIPVVSKAVKSHLRL